MRSQKVTGEGQNLKKRAIIMGGKGRGGRLPSEELDLELPEAGSRGEEG